MGLSRSFVSDNISDPNPKTSTGNQRDHCKIIANHPKKILKSQARYQVFFERWNEKEHMLSMEMIQTEYYERYLGKYE